MRISEPGKSQRTAPPAPILKRINPRIPNVLIAAVFTILLSWYFGFEIKYKTDISAFKSKKIQGLIKSYNDLLIELELQSI